MSKRNIVQCILICFIVLAVRVSYSFELNPSEEKIQNAITQGTRNFMDIFESKLVKPARFGNWPSEDGGLIESKLVYLAIKSSMRVRARMPEISKEEIEEIVNSSEMPIRVSSSKNIFNVVLKQNEKTIEPSRIESAMQMPPAGTDSHLVSLKVFFKYSDINPVARTTVVLYEDFGEIEFEVDFSKFD